MNKSKFTLDDTSLGKYSPAEYSAAVEKIAEDYPGCIVGPTISYGKEKIKPGVFVFDSRYRAIVKHDASERKWHDNYRYLLLGIGGDEWELLFNAKFTKHNDIECTLAIKLHSLDDAQSIMMYDMVFNTILKNIEKAQNIVSCDSDDNVTPTFDALDEIFEDSTSSETA